MSCGQTRLPESKFSIFCRCGFSRDCPDVRYNCADCAKETAGCAKAESQCPTGFETGRTFAFAFAQERLFCADAGSRLLASAADTGKGRRAFGLMARFRSGLRQNAAAKKRSMAGCHWHESEKGGVRKIERVCSIGRVYHKWGLKGRLEGRGLLLMLAKREWYPHPKSLPHKRRRDFNGASLPFPHFGPGMGKCPLYLPLPAKHSERL